jgi:hypothetical protein
VQNIGQTKSLLNQPDRPWWRDALCMENSRKGCDIGSITSTTLLTTSYTSAGSSVPFYFQPTLGGADFESVDTLRGFVDYRLRAPNRLLTQIDFDKAVANLGVKGHPNPTPHFGHSTRHHPAGRRCRF